MSSQIEITKNIITYLNNYGYRRDAIVDNLINETKRLGNVSQMQISAQQGQFLELLVKLTKSKKCLEIGRFTGLSSLCMARGVPDNGQVIAVDCSSEFLHIAEKYWKIAKVEKKIKSIIGQGIDVLNNFINKKIYFDLIFIDADKNHYIDYYESSINLIKSNGLIIIDNTLWGGDVLNRNDKSSKTINLLNKKILKDKRVEFSLLPFVDGVSIIRKN